MFIGRIPKLTRIYISGTLVLGLIVLYSTVSYQGLTSAPFSPSDINHISLPSLPSRATVFLPLASFFPPSPCCLPIQRRDSTSTKPIVQATQPRFFVHNRRLYSLHLMTFRWGSSHAEQPFPSLSPMLSTMRMVNSNFATLSIRFPAVFKLFKTILMGCCNL